MLVFIPKSLSKLILFLGLFTITSCNNSTATHLQAMKQKFIQLPSGEKLKVYIADSVPDQKKGLSTIKPEDFPVNEGMFFTGKRMHVRQFWMPETHFNLDVFFLSDSLYVIDIHRNLQHFPSKEPRHKIPLSKEVFSQHVLEIRADSPLAAKIQPGMVLQWLKK